MGSVLTLSVLLIFFLFLAVLEDVGYMALAAFVMDRFRPVGLHGTSFIPCASASAVMSRGVGASIASRRRGQTMFISPNRSLHGKLAVLTFVSAAVFGPGRLVAWSVLTVTSLMGIVGMTAAVFPQGEPLPLHLGAALYHKRNLGDLRSRVVQDGRLHPEGGPIILASPWGVDSFPGGRNRGGERPSLDRAVLEPWAAPWARLEADVASDELVPRRTPRTLGVLFGVGDAGWSTSASVLATASALASWWSCAFRARRSHPGGASPGDGQRALVLRLVRRHACPFHCSGDRFLPFGPGARAVIREARHGRFSSLTGPGKKANHGADPSCFP